MTTTGVTVTVAVIVVVVALLVAVLIQGLVGVLGRGEQRARAAARDGGRSPGTGPGHPAPVAEAGKPAPHHVAAIAAAVAATMDGVQVVHIERVRSHMGWSAQGRAAHFGSHNLRR